MEKYSVLMTVYAKDDPEFFSLALSSMAEQTYPPDEIVLVKDGPIPDALQQVIDKAVEAGTPIVSVQLEKNKGLGLALNEGIKVVDEAHLHLKGVLKFDAICNIPYNWYLSATLGRSDVQEDNILNRALSDAQRFVGNQEYEEYQKQYVNIFFQDIYYNPSTKLCAEYFRYGNIHMNN